MSLNAKISVLKTVFDTLTVKTSVPMLQLGKL